MSKQTVWLVTMLSLMVVLSAYYIVSGPVEPVDDVATTEEDAEVTTQEANPLELALFGSDGDGEEDAEKGADEAETKEEARDSEGEKTEETGTEDDDTPAISGQDYFLAMQTERSAINSELIEKYTDIMTDPQSSEEQAEAASAKLEELRKTIDQVTEMEELIRGQGYNDALVMHEKGKYDITVQTDSLSKKQAVEILELIQEETDVPATYLTISYHP